jgi:hypothetical protein
LAALRGELSRLPNFTGKEIRAKILALVGEQWDRGIKQRYADVDAAFELELSLDNVRRHMLIAKAEGTLDLSEPAVHGGFGAYLTPAGWKALEAVADIEAARERELVFISCGQFTEEEISLGKALAATIDNLTPYRGYFAENQSGLESLSRHILDALNSCVGFVAVMHYRGTVEAFSKKHPRGSVWVEQEIAIAAFLSQAQGRDLRSAVYIQEGIALEGVRQQLLLGAVSFRDNAEVLENFCQLIKDGLFASRRTAELRG